MKTQPNKFVLPKGAQSVIDGANAYTDTPNELPAFTPIGENRYVDADGVVYSGAEIAAKETISDALYGLAGCALKMR